MGLEWFWVGHVGSLYLKHIQTTKKNKTKLNAKKPNPTQK